MILRIGRWGDDVEVSSPNVWADSSTVGDQTARLSGHLRASTLVRMQAARTELLEQVGAVVAGTWSPDSTRDGFYRLAAAEVDLTEFIPSTDKDIAKMFARLGKTLQAVKNPHLCQLLDALLNDEPLMASFKNAPAAERIQGLISGMGLADDPWYLIELLGRTEGADGKAVAARLKKLTGRDLGQDPDPWRQWLKRRQDR